MTNISPADQAKVLSWVWIVIGAVLGLLLLGGFIAFFGRALAKRLGLEDRGEWDRPLAVPIPKDTVIAVYRRRRHYHRHHRHHYQRRRKRSR